MKAVYCLIALVIVSGSSCASTGNAPPSVTLQNAAIIERSIIPPFTGYIRTWIQFKVSANDTDVVVLLPHFEDGKRIPDIGDTCKIGYHIESVDGQVGDENVQLESANVIDHLECKKT